MRLSFALLVLPAVAGGALPRTAAAQATAQGGGAQCSQLLSEIQAGCDERETAEAELAKLKGAPAAAPNPENAKRIQELEAKVKELSASPFNGWCGGWTNRRPPCNNVATLLEIEIEGLVERGRAAGPAGPAETKDERLAKAEYIAEPDRRTATNSAGTRAQREPVESVQPINLAGGAITLAGTRTGTQGIATTTINPLALADPDDPTLKRLLDLSVTAPFAIEGSVGQDPRFVGVRVRANAAAPYSSAALRAALEHFYFLAGTLADNIEAVLLHKTTDVKRCALAIIKTRQVTLADCGESIDLTQLTQAREASYEALRQAQREADRYYFGLDLRGDFGDPTGDARPGDDGTSLVGTLAAGLRLPRGENWDFEFRVRGGGDYFHSRDTVNGFEINPVFSFDWGAALVFSGHATAATEKQRLAFGIGVEGRHTEKSRSSDLIPTNYLNLNAMIIVPVASGGDLGLSFSVPLVDSEIPRGTIISASTDLGLLDGSGSR